MNSLDDIELLFSAIKNLRLDTRKFHKLSEKGCEMTPQTHTQKSYEKLNNDMNWLAMEISQKECLVHKLSVDCGFSLPYEIEHYDEMLYEPSAWHKYKYKPPLPKCLLT